jgi:hypothetical protein
LTPTQCSALDPLGNIHGFILDQKLIDSKQNPFSNAAEEDKT